MRKTALAGLLVMTILFMSSSKASADTLGLIQSDNRPGADLTRLAALAPLTQINTAAIEPELEGLEPVKYKVVAQDSLSKIAETYNTTWQRLFNKNTALAHPDLIKPGDELVIPSPDETLEERNIPEAVRGPAAIKQTTTNSQTRTGYEQTSKTLRGYSSNGYISGYCTWYAKNRRPDLPNSLGNANTWVSRAQAQGIPTGSTPRVGAIGQQGMHVVYVEAVSGETVTVSEMNFRGRGVISSRTVPASYFRYIY